MTELHRNNISRRGRVGSVAAGYIGASWVVLQVVEVILGLISLPDWVVPGVIILLLIGFFMVVGTGWVQADPETTERELAGEVPGDWQLAPRDALTALASGRLPHLTWGRTFLVGAVALSLLFGVAGAYVVVTEGWPSSSRAAIGDGTEGENGNRIAVLPFSTSGPDLNVYEEGMVELLSTNLDGLGGLRAIDSRTVLARWDERVSADRPDLATSLEVANATGASHALLGSIVAAGNVLRLTGQIYALSTGERVSEVREEGSVDEILAMVDRLSVATAREIIGSHEDFTETGIRIASLTTSSVHALELYLEAEAFYRQGHFGRALPFLDDAVREDPEFGLAVMRRAQAMGWLTETVSPDSIDAARRAIRTVLDRLAPRDAILAEAGIIDYADRDAQGVEMLRAFVARNPDEAEGWYQLSDFLYHLFDIRSGPREEILDGFDRAVELGPRFAPYYIHAIEAALIRADRPRFDELLARYQSLELDEGRAREWQIASAMVFESDSALLAEVAATDPNALEAVLRPIRLNSDRPQQLANVAEQYTLSGWTTVELLLRAGRWSSARRYLAQNAQLESRAEQTVEGWIGAFDLGHEPTILLGRGAPSMGDSSWWTPESDADAMVETMLADRDNGTGADPVLLAHLAERSGDLELAARLFEAEGWRYYGPATTYRLARLRDRQGRAEAAVVHYRTFLELWSGADGELLPMAAAREALVRLGG